MLTFVGLHRPTTIVVSHRLKSINPPCCSEAAIAAASAAVYYFDTETTQWVPVDGGLSVVYIYQNSETNSFRVIGMSQVEANKVGVLRVHASVCHRLT
jgi:hypothetical protein